MGTVKKVDYYMCKECKTKICSEADNLQIFHSAEMELCGQLFEKASNVYDGVPRQVGRHTVADFYCVGCEKHMGWKYILVGGEESTVKHNMMKLILPRLLKKQGGQILDAETLESVVPNGRNPAPEPGPIPEVQNPNPSDAQLIPAPAPGPAPEVQNPNPNDEQVNSSPETGPVPEIQNPIPNDNPHYEVQNPPLPPGPPPLTPPPPEEEFPHGDD